MAGKKPSSPRNVVQSAAELLSLDANSPALKESGKQLAQAAETVTTLVNVVLLPIAAVNYGYRKAKDYFHNEFEADLENFTNRIPPDRLEEPKASIAAPILQGLAFSHEESELKEMYLRLLATAMDEESSWRAHPAYVEIIRQLTPIEARALKRILVPPWTIPIVNLRTQKGEIYTERYRNVVNFMNFETDEEIDMISSMVDNWERLGLFSVDYTKLLPEEEHGYDWVESHMTYRLVEEKFDQQAEIVKGLMMATNFGRLFTAAVIVDS